MVADRSQLELEVDDVVARVQRGVALLDAYGPARWWKAVDLRRIDVGAPDRCVLGQVFGVYGGPASYALVGRRGGDPGYVAWACGFQRAPRGGAVAAGSPEFVADYRALTDAWRAVLREIKRRRR